MEERIAIARDISYCNRDDRTSITTSTRSIRGPRCPETTAAGFPERNPAAMDRVETR